MSPEGNWICHGSSRCYLGGEDFKKGASWRAHCRLPSGKVQALQYSHVAGTFSIPRISDWLAFPSSMTAFVFCARLGARNTGFWLFFLDMQDEGPGTTWPLPGSLHAWRDARCTDACRRSNNCLAQAKRLPPLFT